jgi:phosphate starvation-inducible protein PhoH and related proteins
VLEGVDGIGFVHFESGDVVRHPLVQRIVQAYDNFGRVQPELPLQMTDEEGRTPAQPQ